VTPHQRADLYAFLSRLWVRELDAPARALVAGPLGAALLPRFSASPEHAVMAGADADRAVATFDTDYVHVTVVNVVPYASFYRSDTGVVESGTVNALSPFYQECGFEADLVAARAVAPDHLGITLEVLARLCAAEAEAADRPLYAAQIRSLQQRMLAEHVLDWAPMYLDAVRRCAHTALYAEAAEVTLDFLASHLQDLADGVAR
jgi:TorA maturation chaperone TorD